MKNTVTFLMRIFAEITGAEQRYESTETGENLTVLVPNTCFTYFDELSTPLATASEFHNKDRLNVSIEVSRAGDTQVEETQFLFFEAGQVITYADYSAPQEFYVYPGKCWPGYTDGQLPAGTSFKVSFNQRVTLEKQGETSRVTLKVNEGKLVSETDGKVYTLPEVEPMVYNFDYRIPGKAHESHLVEGEEKKAFDLNSLVPKNQAMTVESRLITPEGRDSLYPVFRPLGRRIGEIRKVKLLACGTDEILSSEDIYSPFTTQLEWAACPPDWFAVSK